MIRSKIKKEKGSGMVEILIASAIMVTVVISVVGVYHSLTRISLQNTENIQGAFLMEEGVEAVRVMRDNAWSNIASSTVGTPYYFRWQSGTWRATTSPQVVDVFYRTVVFSNVNRDTNFNIVTSGGTLDTGTKKATISVSWPSRTGTTTKSTDMYIFKSFNN